MPDHGVRSVPTRPAGDAAPQSQFSVVGVGEKVFIEAADLVVSFVAGETIWTESSHKFQPAEMFEMAEKTGFRVRTQWVDHEWPFVESLWAVP